ncbi:MAG TPA: branched-chain amino acid ABC transporter permease [Chloroflexota bacterium]|nr:branched-chain amino acid ABC transporter permease [Chloroflexota bacterium]
MQWYDEIIQVLLIGIANGAIIALIALGYTLVYGIIELINFAHGDVFMIGTMISLTLVTWVPGVLGVRQATQLPPLALVGLIFGSLLASILVCAGLNVAIERIAYRRLRNAPRLAPLITAIGVSFILVNVGLVWKGASQVNYPDLVPRVDILRDIFHIDTLILFTLKDLLVIVIAVPLMIGLTLFVQRTRLGKAMRATAQDRTAAAMMGIDINMTIALTFLIGGAMAGAAGTIFGLYNNSAWFFQGFRNGLYSFTAAVMGGIGNIQGAFLGGMIIGLVAALADRVWDPRWTEAVVFALLVVILIFRPTGLLGEETSERA